MTVSFVGVIVQPITAHELPLDKPPTEDIENAPI